MKSKIYPLIVWLLDISIIFLMGMLVYQNNKVLGYDIVRWLYIVYNFVISAISILFGLFFFGVSKAMNTTSNFASDLIKNNFHISVLQQQSIIEKISTLNWIVNSIRNVVIIYLAYLLREKMIIFSTILSFGATLFLKEEMKYLAKVVEYHIAKEQV